MIRCYHGTDIDSAINIYQKQTVDLKIGSRTVDFGKGFYTTDDKETAISWANRKAKVRNKRPALVTVYFDNDAALPYIMSFDDDLRWGRFVINNRNGLSYINRVPFKENNLDGRYDITRGRIADYQVRQIAHELNMEGKMLDSVEFILKESYAIQYVFHTDFALSFIKKITYETL